MIQEANNTDEVLVTIVVVQRERFSLTRRSLESLYEHTQPPFDLVYVDAGSPRKVARYLARESRSRGFRLLQFPHYIPPHRARNMGAEIARTRYVVFVDNDVLFSKHWLDALIECAETTQADLVTPVICIGEPVHTTVHVAGGSISRLVQDGRRRLQHVMRFQGRPLSEVNKLLKREPTELIEFHCVLVRRELFKRIGPFDEAYLASSEHLDLSLMVLDNNGSIYLEPASIVTYLAPPPLALSDIPYYTLRWSDEWAIASEQHFHRKWNLEFDDRITRFAVMHRRIAFRRLRRGLLTVAGWRRSQRFSSWLDRVLIAFAERNSGAQTRGH